MPRRELPTPTGNSSGATPGWLRVGVDLCARLSTPHGDPIHADRELEQIFRDSRLGSWLDFVTRATETAWAESRTRAVVRWLAGTR